jgi:putative PEP-CTERM system histidine kinase
MIDILPVLSSLLVFLGYSLFALLLLTRGRRQLLTFAMALASALTALWALVTLLGREDLAPISLIYQTGALKDVGWLGVLLAMANRSAQPAFPWRSLMTGCALLVATHLLLAGSGLTLGTFAGVRLDIKVTGILVTIAGGILVENLARNASRDQFWAIKYFMLGMGTILSFQFIIQIVEFVTRLPSTALLLATPFFYLLSLPLFALTAIRNPASHLQVHSSRQVVFHTATLVLVGIVLQGTAIAAFYLRNYGGDASAALIIILAFTALVGTLALMMSGTLRSHLRNMINRNFFNYKYDYRDEWTKFIRALSTAEETGTPLKVLRTFADLMDSPGGALWIQKESFRQFVPMAKWSIKDELKPYACADAALQPLKDETVTLIDLSLPAADNGFWREQFPGHWLIVPMRYRSELVAFILLQKPRAPRTLDWEDKNLVSLVARQLAVYLVNDETSQALLEANQMAEFNKRFAFLIHDMKNTIGQLDLLARNAERFSENPAFREDMNITLRNSVEKLNALLVQIRGDKSGDSLASAGDKNVDAVSLVSSFVKEKQGMGLPVVMENRIAAARPTIADDRTLLNVLEHVVANAVEATAPETNVSIQLAAQSGAIQITVSDKGPGMSQEFINESLFRPFKTTKQMGFGMGAYQARETVRKLGGDFEVLSKVGRGTNVVISLPCKLNPTARAV